MDAEIKWRGKATEAGRQGWPHWADQLLPRHAIKDDVIRSVKSGKRDNAVAFVWLPMVSGTKCNKPGSLKQQECFSPVVLEIRRLKSRCWQDHVPSETYGGSFSPLLALGVCPTVLGLWSHHCTLSSIATGPSFPCVSVSVSLSSFYQSPLTLDQGPPCSSMASSCVCA